MSSQTFDFQGALEAGYTEDEVVDFLSSKKGFDSKAARDSGYDSSEILQFLNENQQEETIDQNPDRSLPEKAARVGGQFGLGMIEGVTFPVEAYLASQTSTGKQADNIRNEIVKDMEWLAEKKMFGTATQEDEQRLQQLQELYQNPEAINEITQDYGDLSVRRGIEKVTGIDLKPEGFIEGAANIAGFIKNPSKIAKAGLNPNALLKSIAPTGKELLKSGAMEAGLEYARDGDFGPVGQIGMMILGDLAVEGGAGLAKSLKSPKKTLASIAAKRAMKNESKELVKQLRESGIQADLGTITDSNLVKMIQTKLDQSGLTGDALDNLRKSIFDDVKQEYKQIADGINEYRFQSEYDAGTVMKETLEEVRESDLSRVRSIYEDARNKTTSQEVISTNNLNKTVDSILEDMSKGTIKSSEQRSVIEALEKIKSGIETEEGAFRDVSPQSLMNDKIALTDIINYEVQGGAKQKLKEVERAIDQTLKRFGKIYDKEFLKNYTNANKEFSKHAKDFRNKSIINTLNQQTPERALKLMDTVDGINKLEKSLSRTPEGRFAYEALKRNKLDNLFSKSMVNNLENQLKIGQFKNIFDNKKNQELIKRLMQPRDFERFRKLTNNAGAIQRTGAKFLNPSQSGVVMTDVAIIGKLIADIGHMLHGNPFPLLRTSGGVLASRYLTNLMGDRKFIKIVEDLILAESKGNISKMIEMGEKLRPYAKEYLNQSESE